jgi:hypothetical protein
MGTTCIGSLVISRDLFSAVAIIYSLYATPWFQASFKEMIIALWGLLHPISRQKKGGQ